MTTEPTVSDVLRKAAEILAERGHCKGEFEDEQSRVCMWGAIATACEVRFAPGALGLEGRIPPAMLVIDDLIAQQGIDGRAPGGYPGADWNDTPERTGTEVEKFLIGLADKAEFGDPS